MGQYGFGRDKNSAITLSCLVCHRAVIGIVSNPELTDGSIPFWIGNFFLAPLVGCAASLIKSVCWRWQYHDTLIVKLVRIAVVKAMNPTLLGLFAVC